MMLPQTSPPRLPRLTAATLSEPLKKYRNHATAASAAVAFSLDKFYTNRYNYTVRSLCGYGEIGRRTRFRLRYVIAFIELSTVGSPNRQQILIREYGGIGRRPRFRLRYVIEKYNVKPVCVKSTKINIAPVVKLADTIDLGSISERSAGSIPVRCTKKI